MRFACHPGPSQRHLQHPLDDEVFQREQIAIMQQQLPLIVVADSVAGLYLFAILKSQHQSPQSWIWVATLAMVSFGRGIIVLRNARLEHLRWIKS